MSLSPQETVEAALERSRADETIVIVDHSATVNIRFANNTMTTNGSARATAVTIIAITGCSVGAVSRTGLAGLDELGELVASAEAAARANPPAEDAGPLLNGNATADFGDLPEETSIEVFGRLIPELSDELGRARASDYKLYGYAEHIMSTTYLGTSSGLRLRHTQPQGTIDMTGRSHDGDSSAWAGRATPDFSNVVVSDISGEVTRRLQWSARRVELDAGRYETLLPPSGAADMLGYMSVSMAARDAHEGRSAFSKAGGGTKLGDRLCSLPVSLRSDPRDPDIDCRPFVVAHASTERGSVFDNGLPLARTDWITDGILTALVTTRHTAALTGLPVTPHIDNLVLESTSPGPELEEMIADTRRGLLLTCLWYIREVDPETLLLTGLTRDGVFLVENGEITGAVNNFRFNESPLAMLERLVEVGPSRRTLAREFQEWLREVRMPPLRVADFNMSSVSQAS